MTPHSTTGYTPYELHYGKVPKNKIKTLIQFPPETSEPHEIKIEIANERTRAAFERRKTRQNCCRDPPLKVGDLVLLKIPKSSNALNKKVAKFFHIYYGPYTVARVFNDNA